MYYLCSNNQNNNKLKTMKIMKTMKTMGIEKLTIEEFNEIEKTIKVEYAFKPKFASTKICLTEVETVVLVDEINQFIIEVKSGDEIKEIISNIDNNKGWFATDNNETYINNTINALEEKEWIF